MDTRVQSRFRTFSMGSVRTLPMSEREKREAGLRAASSRRPFGFTAERVKRVAGG